MQGAPLDVAVKLRQRNLQIFELEKIDLEAYLAMQQAERRLVKLKNRRDRLVPPMEHLGQTPARSIRGPLRKAIGAFLRLFTQP